MPSDPVAARLSRRRPPHWRPPHWRPPHWRPPLAWEIAWRFLRGRHSRLLDGTARAALAATALGVTAMVVTMALMTGYREDLQRKLIGDNAAVGAYPLSADAATLGEAELAELERIPGVLRVGRVAYGQGMLAAADPATAREVTVRGVDPGEAAAAPGADVALPRQLATGEDGLPGAVLGVELAHRLGVGEGDVVRLTVLGFGPRRPRFRYLSLRVGGTFRSGLAEFDNGWMVVERQRLEEATGGAGAGGAVLYEFALEEPHQASRVAAAAEQILGDDYLVTDWRDLNRELFYALRLQKVVLFFVLALIVLVSVFNVASTLMVLLRERMRDVGVLGAMGMAPRKLRSIFLVYGGVLGAVGTLLGVLVGSTLCWVLTTFELIRFDPEVASIYFISSVPFRVTWSDLALIVTFSLVLTVLVCTWVSRPAARVEPSTALRYE